MVKIASDFVLNKIISPISLLFGFFNDVCPIGQMMYATHMMLPSASDVVLTAHGQTSHHCGMKWSNIISEQSDETSLAVKDGDITKK